jgi:CDGSH-type Zn-finger protein
MMPTPDDRPRCGCGKSIHQPYCDGSHARTPEQLKEWRDKIELARYQQQAADLWSDRDRKSVV